MKGGDGSGFAEQHYFCVSESSDGCFTNDCFLCERSPELFRGDKGYIIVDNINNPQLAVVYSVNHEEVARYTCPPQITGFEYQVQASHRRDPRGKIETPCMPHAETLHIMQMLDDLRSEWGGAVSDGLND